jgi:formate dehydrogenase major subunit
VAAALLALAVAMPVPRIRVVINGQPREVPGHGTILDALTDAGVELPTLCHDARLTPTGACRLCLVELASAPRPVPACATPIAGGMEIRTHTPALVEFRQYLLASLARHYPGELVRRSPEMPFHRLLDAHGLAGADPAPRPAPRDTSHPFIAVDMSRCIDCYRCVRICDELQGRRVWHVRGRGIGTTIQPDGPSLRDSPCVSCGACVDTCPTGALEDAHDGGAGPLDWTRTTCPYCGVGCEMFAGTRDGRIVRIRPVPGAPVSKGHLCVKGRYGFGFVSAADRVTEPMIRRGGEWTAVSWDEALQFTAGRLQSIVEAYGPDAVGVLGSARATNEDNYVAQKFARLVAGTNNVDCCARVCHAPSAVGLRRALGTGLATNSFDDIERARTIVVCGANPTENHPIVGARILQAARRGARLIVIDPRRIELAEAADVHLAVRPGTNVALLNAMAAAILEEGLEDRAFIDARVTGREAFAAFLADWTPEHAASICGVSAEAIRHAARLYATGKPSLSVHGLGVTEHTQGTDGVVALTNLALLTGNIGRPGCGVNPLRGQNNVQGAAHMGCDPAVLPGSTPLDSGRDHFARAWRHVLPRTPGLHLMTMLDAALTGELKALWTIGYDILLTNPQADRTARALAALELVVVQDLFLNETARQFGTVFLPACSSFGRASCRERVYRSV